MAYQIFAFTQAGAKAAVLEKAFGISLTKEANAAPTLATIGDVTKWSVYHPPGVALTAISLGGFNTTTQAATLLCTVASGLTAGDMEFLIGNTTTGTGLLFDAEL